VLIPTVLAFAALMLLLIGAIMVGAPVWLLILLAAAAGAPVPVATIAFATAHHGRALRGLLLGAWGASGALAGLGYGALG
jgi:hypothetical protein